MKFSRIKYLSLIIVVVFSLTAIFTACGTDTTTTSAGGQTTTTEAEEKEDIIITFTWWGAELRHNKFNAILDLYESQNSHVTIDRMPATWPDYWTRLATQSVSGDTPDAFGMVAQNKGEYAAKNAMTPLEEYVDRGLIDLSEFAQGVIDSGKVNDTLYFISFGGTASSLLYNKTLLDTYGADYPTGGMSFDTYIEYLIGVQELLPEGYYAANYITGEHVFENYVRQMGYELTTPDNSALGYPKEVARRFFEFNYQLRENGVVPSPEVYAEMKGAEWSDTLAGQGYIATWDGNVNHTKVLQASIDDELAMVRSFIADDAERRYVEMAQPSGWAIGRNAENKDEIAKLISWFVNDEEAQEIFYMELGVPGSAKIQDMLISGMDPENNVIDRVMQNEINLIQEIMTSIEPHPGRTASAPALITDLVNKIEAVIFDQMTIDQAVDAHFDAMASIMQ